MKRPINAVLFGVGAMGKLAARYMVDKGVNIVGAFNRTSHIGEDLGIVAGLEQPLDVTVSSIETAALDRDVDIAVLTTVSDLISLYPVAEQCLQNGVNVVTISEQAFFPLQNETELAEKLDKLAKNNNATIVSTGVQDIFWLNVPSVVSGACHLVEAVYGSSTVNLDVYGPAVVSHFPIGLTRDRYESDLDNETDSKPLPIFGIAAEALVADLDLTVLTRALKYEPLFDDVPVKSRSLDRVIEPGLITGLSEIYEIETKEEITFRVEFIQKIFNSNETEKINWQIEGTPSISLSFDPFMGGEITCTTLVNRIPDVINAEPGFLPASELAKTKYRPLSLHHYIN